VVVFELSVGDEAPEGLLENFEFDTGARDFIGVHELLTTARFDWVSFWCYLIF
jgi:hypothetical protein